MARDYSEFLDSKRQTAESCGFEPSEVNPMLYGFQKDIVKWACRKGKAAIFADCGMGKTPMQLEWAHQVVSHEGGMVLILAPLAVSAQTVREGSKFGIDVNRARTSDDLKPGINITNYEMLEHFEGVDFTGIVLDESSILKNYSGKTRNMIIDRFKATPFKLACTATPSPNDHMELGNHAEFLGVMNRTEILSMFFIHDGSRITKWRLKGHARDKFWEWVSTWSVMVTSPSDLGYEDGDFTLPELTINTHELDSHMEHEDTLFTLPSLTLSDQQRARRSTVEIKGDFIAQLVNQSDEPWLVWCDLNAESEHIAKSIPDAIEVRGSDSPEFKEDAMLGFADGRYRVLVTKPSICGFGMNWQHCSHMAFCGLSHSYEQFYQAVRRCWRYGQMSPVNVEIVVTDAESAIVENVVSKRESSKEMKENMTKYAHLIRDDADATSRGSAAYVEDDEHGDHWTLMMGDCCERIKEIPDESIDFSVFSPPFASLYTFSDSERDMSNCRSIEEFYNHFRYLSDELFRVMAPGRLVSIHCINLPATKNHDGYIGIRDFRGDIIRIFEDSGFYYHAEVTIWKDPVTAMQRTKSIRLLNKQKNKDSSLSGQGIPDYLVTMRKPGENLKPITHTDETFPLEVWQKYASPVWMDIAQGRTLQKQSAKENNDERHISPLQLDVIERAVELWSNPGDMVLSPFAGIGSEGYVSVLRGRRFTGIELKPSYFRCAVNNLAQAEIEASQATLFDFKQVGE